MKNLQRYSMIFLIFSLFGCFQKKKQPENLGDWLEINFPGQLVVVNNIVNLDLKNLYYKKKETIVADKNDPEVQIKVTWFKNENDLDLSKEEIQTAWEKSKNEVAAARALFSALHEKGLEKISVGVIDMAAYILIFEDPTPPVRKKYLEQILATLDARHDTTQTSIWIECMEDSAYGEEFKDIIPYGYWKRGGTLHEDQKIMSLDFEWAPGLKIDNLMTGWAINTMSERSSIYMNEAYTTASAWASKNLPSPFYLEPAQMVRIGPDEDDPLAIGYDFPYYASKPDTTDVESQLEPLGYISVSYQTDQKVFTKIKKVKGL
jgi:hypothetical protein